MAQLVKANRAENISVFSGRLVSLERTRRNNQLSNFNAFKINVRYNKKSKNRFNSARYVFRGPRTPLKQLHQKLKEPLKVSLEKMNSKAFKHFLFLTILKCTTFGQGFAILAVERANSEVSDLRQTSSFFVDKGEYEKFKNTNTGRRKTGAGAALMVSQKLGSGSNEIEINAAKIGQESKLGDSLNPAGLKT